jgi:alpha-ketoglutaric semialdehyde dehydrogenase
MAFGDLFVGGEWRGGLDRAPDINPSDLDDVVGTFALANDGDMDDAIDAAEQAQAAWSATSPQARADVLWRISAEISARSDELGTLLAREEGKTVAEGIGEAVRAAQIFQFFAGEAVRMNGEHLASTRPGIFVDLIREPVGVVGVITPWNFPLAIPAWKIAPSLAYGNTVIFKPAELVPGCAWHLVDIAARAGVPDGVLNLVLGDGALVGPVLTRSPKLDALSFTGSQPVGQLVAAAAVANLTKLQLEMGGKNPLVVLADADLATAVDCAVQGAFYSTGQRCTASSRLVVEDAIYEPFVAAVRDRLNLLRVGHALDKTTDIGPVVDEQQLGIDLAYLEIARSDGGEIAVGGEVLERPTKGHYLSPALILGTTNDQRINREEAFGPIATVIRVADPDEALAVANDTEFGLSAGVCTTSLRLAEHFRSRLDAGMVMVNVPTAGVDPHVPFGGRKKSSYGPREQGAYAREFFTVTKTTYVRP